MSDQVTFTFSGNSVLLFGATSGIGWAIALAFAAAGARLVAAGLGGDREALTADLLAAGATDALVLEVDVRDEEQVSASVAAAVERFGSLDIAVNNAGIEGPFAPIQDLTGAQFDDLIAVNLRGVWCGMKHEIRHMQARGGAILNMTSTAGVRAIPFVSAYSATKHGIIGLTRAAALELASSGIRVNAIAPGPVATGLLDRMIAGHIDKAQIAEKVPLQRIADPSEIARAALFLCSDAASFVTGEVLMIDGGMTL